jgi:predicted acylesterase/phospholipase RssA
MAERRKCDLVMQGGVTSGVVFPGLVCKLAEYYDFQNIGGTSAGAIAASLTAAAEYARRNGKTHAFDEVAKVAKWLGGRSAGGRDSNLFALFQPQSKMAGLFRFAVAFLISGKTKQALSWLSVFWIEIIIGIIPGATLGHFAARVSGWDLWIGLLTFLVCAAGICVTAMVGLLLRLTRLPGNYWGLCTGHARDLNPKAPALVPWLSGEINQIAGKPENEPLTFGDLKKRQITLSMMTTCLTWGRPYTLPFRTREFYFSPEEFRDFFPEGIVTWLINHPPKPKEGEKHHDPDRRGKVNWGTLKPLPDEDDLPVIVAARLSLSFPFLFCTVPLYSVDYTLRECDANEDPPEPPVQGGPIAYGADRIPEHVWFTDGGICNNFPLHLFDAPVPRWPTFGIDLTDLRPDRPKGESRAWMPTKNGGGVHPAFTRLPVKGGVKGTFGLVVAIVNSARNWVNSLQAVVPGYRDRIVHIALSKKEGGLNLIMPPETLDSLNKYGCEAAQLLIDHFIHGTDNGEATPMTWNNQRFIRYRSTMALLETFLAKFAYGMNNPEPGDVPYSQLIKRGPHEPPPTGYRFDPAQIPYAVYETDKLIEIGNQMGAGDLQDGSPKPEPALVIRPNF